MQKRELAQKIRAFVETCHAHCLKITPQRVAIYRELVERDDHPTAHAVYRVVRDEHPHISFDTVNRSLLTFAKIGIVDVVEIFGKAKRFDPDVTSHHHLHCVRCGKILDFCHHDFDNLEVPPKIARRFRVISKRVVLKGICDECRKKTR